jgi:diacylglycerol kinase (ATP)
MRTRVFVNPAAGKGRLRRAWPLMRQQLESGLGALDVVQTEGPGHATALARQAAAEGVQRYIAAGGDGTVNEVLNGMLDETGQLLVRDALLCPLPGGTANELCRALGLLRGPELPYAACEPRRTRRLDLTVTRCRGFDGAPVQRFGYLITSFGQAATISHETSRSRVLKRLGGRFSYFAVTLLVTLTYRARPIRMSIDGGPETSRLVLSGLCCNTENGGGGMRLAPGADPGDGVLDYVEFGNLGRLDILTQKPSWLFEGRHVEHAKVRCARGRTLRFASDVETLVDVDGETVGRLPLDVSLRPGALTVGVA